MRRSLAVLLLKGHRLNVLVSLGGCLASHILRRLAGVMEAVRRDHCSLPIVPFFHIFINYHERLFLNTDFK